MIEIRKKIFTFIVAICLTFGTNLMYGQVFVLEDEESNRSGQMTDQGLIVPGYNLTIDQYYAPLGSGALLLAGLAGAYLIGKKKEK